MPNSKWSGHDWWIAVVGFFLANPIIINEALTRYRIHERQTYSLAVNIKKSKKRRSYKDIFFRIKRETKRIILKGRIKKIRSEEKKERKRTCSEPGRLKSNKYVRGFEFESYPKGRAI
ncbi:MAG: hypothetical protein JRJ57_06370 [Deltaproteobacteria bacterium]|nr:hypothetical protein [Deltaproteobacteria bacterium]